MFNYIKNIFCILVEHPLPNKVWTEIAWKPKNELCMAKCLFNFNSLNLICWVHGTTTTYFQKHYYELMIYVILFLRLVNCVIEFIYMSIYEINLMFAIKFVYFCFTFLLNAHKWREWCYILSVHTTIQNHPFISETHQLKKRWRLNFNHTHTSCLLCPVTKWTRHIVLPLSAVRTSHFG